MNIDIHLLPYDTGRRDWRMGAGPEHFIQNGLDAFLASGGQSVHINHIETKNSFPAEIQTAFELYGKLAQAVAVSEAAGRFPLILSGNCGSAIGTVSGLSPRPLGIIWFDAHGDFNTPETTVSGYLDGMGLAVAAGLCWKSLAATIPQFRPITGSHILHIGSSDIEPAELGLMQSQGVSLASYADLNTSGLASLLPALDKLREQVRDVYVHLDLDVLDPTLTQANHFPACCGLRPEQVQSILKMIRERFTIRALGVASYDPAYDPQGNTLRAGMNLIRAVVE